MPPRSAAEPDLELAGVDVELGNFRKQDVSPSYSQVQSSSDKVPASDKAPDAETPPPSFFTILSLSKPEWPFLIFAFLLMIAGEAFGLYIPLCLASVYDAITNAALSSDDMLSVIQTKMGLVFVLHWSAMILATIRGTIIGIAGERVVARLRNDLYNHLLVQDLSWHDSMKTGDLVSRLGTDTTLIQGLTTGSLPEIVINLIKVVACITLMVIISPKLAGLTFAVVLFLLVTVVPFGAYIGSLAKKYNDALADAAGKSTEALGSMRTVRSFAAEKKEAARYTSKIGEPSKAGPCWFPFSDTDTTYLHGTKKALVSAFVFCILGLGVAFSAMYGTLWVGFIDVVEGKLSLGNMVAFQNYVFQIVLAIGAAGGHLTAALTARGAASRVFELLAQKSEVESRGSGPVDGGKMEGRVEFRGVNFAYPSRPDVTVLRNFDLDVQSKTTVALVGSSGAGKSTLISLLERFYDLDDKKDSGAVLVDGVDIRTLDARQLRNNIGLVAQEPVLFGLSITDNVKYGVTREVTQEDVEKACELANAKEFVLNFPEGFATMVGERGVKLSGGQKQRLAIARALLVDPKILLFDEATSALDAESEHVVQEAIDRLMVNRTTIIVAHRLSTVMKADKIVVIDDHAIVDAGTHGELLERCEKYKDLVKRQMGNSSEEK